MRHGFNIYFLSGGVSVCVLRMDVLAALYTWCFVQRDGGLNMVLSVNFKRSEWGRRGRRRAFEGLHSSVSPVASLIPAIVHLFLDPCLLFSGSTFRRAPRIILTCVRVLKCVCVSSFLTGRQYGTMTACVMCLCEALTAMFTALCQLSCCRMSGFPATFY